MKYLKVLQIFALLLTIGCSSNPKPDIEPDRDIEQQVKKIVKKIMDLGDDKIWVRY